MLQAGGDVNPFVRFHPSVCTSVHRQPETVRKLLSAQRRRVPVVEEPDSVAGTGPKRFFAGTATISPAVRPSGPV